MSLIFKCCGFQEQVQCLFVGLVALSFFVFNYFPFLFFSSIGLLCGAGVFGLIRCQSPSPGLALPIFFNNNNNNIQMPVLWVWEAGRLNATSGWYLMMNCICLYGFYFCTAKLQYLIYVLM